MYLIMESNEELSVSKAQRQGLVLVEGMARISVIRKVDWFKW
jgi:hypothetical protein